MQKCSCNRRHALDTLLRTTSTCHVRFDHCPHETHERAISQDRELGESGSEASLRTAAVQQLLHPKLSCETRVFLHSGDRMVDWGSPLALPNYRWSSRHTAWAVAVGASLSTAAVAYRLYTYHGWFSRAGVRPVSDGNSASCQVKRAVDEYLQSHYASEQEVLPYPHSPKVQ